MGQDDVVVVALRNSPEHLFTGFGAWKLGASVLPLRWDLPEWERDRLLAVAREANGKVVVAGWENATPGTVTPDDIDATTNLSSDPPEPDGIPPYTRLIATSGATGSPKIVVTPSPGVMAVDDELTQVMTRASGRPYLTTSPLYHVNGFAYAYNPLLQDNPVVLMETVRRRARRRPHRAVPHRVHLHGAHDVDARRAARRRAVARLLEHRTHRVRRRVDPRVGGARVVRAGAARAVRVHLRRQRGSSASVMTTGDQWLEHPGTVGKPLLGEAKILDEDGNELPTGEIGEIYLRGEATGPRFHYIGQPTPEAAPGGFGSFGDMGYVDEDGFIYIADRRTRHDRDRRRERVPGRGRGRPDGAPGGARRRGRRPPRPRVGPPRAHDRRGRRIRRTRRRPTSSREHVKARLSSYKVPKTYETVERIPRSGAGKVNRSGLVEERASAGRVASRASRRAARRRRRPCLRVRVGLHRGRRAAPVAEDDDLVEAVGAGDDLLPRRVRRLEAHVAHGALAAVEGVRPADDEPEAFGAERARRRRDLRRRAC